MFKVVSIEQLRQETATYDKLDGKNFTLQPDFSSGGGDRCYFHVARNRLSGRIIGYIQYRVENETNEAKCHAHICHLEVLEPYREGGFATRLVIAAQDYLKRVCLFLCYRLFFVMSSFETKLILTLGVRFIIKLDVMYL
jgi:ribosomal protein S18 acetylase RimI-like enzyme